MEGLTRKERTLQVTWVIMWLVLFILFIVLPEHDDRKFIRYLIIMGITMVIPLGPMLGLLSGKESPKFAATFILYLIGCAMSLLYGHFLT